MMNNFSNKLLQYQERVRHVLEKSINANTIASKRLREAMLYSTGNGGKRLRPVLVYAVGECFGQSLEILDTVAAAVECIHCYSLIHDDLPAMDNDQLRRGKPTCHIAFDEATAILAGDALQAMAFELLAQPSTIRPPNQLQLIQLLAHYAGASGMVDGQSLDLLAEGKKITIDELEQIHQLKTGALMTASMMMGAVAAECNDTHKLAILKKVAHHIGLAFQLRDDVLDITGQTADIGKNVGQDIKMQKATYAILFGIEKTEALTEALTNEAIGLLQSLPENTDFLQALCHYLIKRAI